MSNQMIAHESPGENFTVRIEKNIEIPVRDGTRLKADLFRPDADGRFPVIMTLGPYPKDNPFDPRAKVEEHGPYMHWETVNPEWWVPRGYAQIRVDMRGTGKSPGFCDLVSRGEAEDYYDAIEWAAQQPWCNGKVGLIGISYFAQNQWRVAALNPPSLKAIIPWEGWGDLYRDFIYHGGIGSMKFIEQWFANRVVKATLGDKSESWRERFAPFLENLKAHPLFDDYYRDRVAEWDRVTVPFLSAGNWCGPGLHLRGNTEAYFRAASKHKRLRMHTGTHIGPFYERQSRPDQQRFLDYWLKGVDNGLQNEPPVKLWIRTGASEGMWRYENEWPLARTQWTPFYLDARDDSLKAGDKPAVSHTHSYSAEGPPSSDFRGASFVTPPLIAELEITGPINLVMWVSSSTQDMDLFAVLRHIGPDGMELVFPEGEGQTRPYPVAKGWLRASHRKLDPSLSKPFRPYHVHDEKQKLLPNEPVRVEVEILPTSCVFKKGHRIQIDIQPWDDWTTQSFRHENSINCYGTHTIHTGGDMSSYLLLPVIPAK